MIEIFLTITILGIVLSIMGMVESLILERKGVKFFLFQIIVFVVCLHSAIGDIIELVTK